MFYSQGLLRMNCIYGGKTGEEMKQKIRDIIIIWLLLVTSFLVWRTDRHFENIQTIVDILKTKGW